MRKSLLAAIIGLAMLTTVLPVSSGQVQFGHTWGTTLGEIGSAVEVDSSGNIYLAGDVWDDSVNVQKAFVVKTNIAGALAWDLLLSSPTSHLDLRDCAIDPSGNLIVVGPYVASDGTDQGTYYAMISPSGSLMFQGWLPDLNEVSRVCLDLSGNGFLIIGDMASYGRGAVVAVGNDGAVRWSSQAMSPELESPWAVVTGQLGSVYVFLDSVMDSNVDLAKLSSSGELIRQVTLKTGDPDYEYTWDLLIGADGNVYALGANYGVGTLLLASFTPNLDLIWDEYVGTTADGYEATRLVQAADGSLYAIGYSTYMSDGTSGPAVFKFDSSGAILESSYFGWDVMAGMMEMNDAVAYPDGGIIVAGASMSLPQNVPVAIGDLVISDIPEAWTEDSTTWSVASIPLTPGDIAVEDVDGTMDNFDWSQGTQAWFGIIDPPAPSFSVTITKRVNTDTYTVDFRCRASGGHHPYTYSWFFGDGSTASGQRASHEYSVGGIFTASVMVIDGSGMMSYASTEVVLPAWPIVNSLDCAPNPPYAGDAIQFFVDAYDPDGGDIVNYVWDFGDNTSISTNVPSANHTYPSQGFYNVWVQTIDDEGQNSGIIITVEVLPLNTPPYVYFYVSSGDLVAGELVTFEGSQSFDPDGQVVSYLWNFGDSGNASGAVVSHIFSSEGTYDVSLTVMDNMGASTFMQQTYTIQPGGQGDLVLLETFDSWSSIHPGWSFWNCTSPLYNYIDVRDGVMYMSNYYDIPVDDSLNARAFWTSLVQYNDTLRLDYQLYLPLASYEKYGYWGQWVLFDLFAPTDNQNDYNWASITSRFLMDTWSGAVNGWSYVGSDGIAHKICDFQAGWHDVSVEMHRGSTTWTAGFDGSTYPGLTFRTPGETGFDLSKVLFVNSLREEIEVAEVDNLMIQRGQGDSPPVASFTYSVVGATVNVDASSSSAPAGIASYSWDWGDGSAPEMTTTPFASHTYGPTMTSTVSEPLGSASIETVPYNVWGYVIHSNASPALACPVLITNLRTGESYATSTDSEYGYYMFDLFALPGGFIAGDTIQVSATSGQMSGTATGIVMSPGNEAYLQLDIVLNQAGNIQYYVVTLTLADQMGRTDSSAQTVGVTIPPVSPDEYEPDDDYASATSLDFNVTQTHSIHDLGADVDWFMLDAPGAIDVVLETFGSRGDTMLYLYDDALSMVSSDDNSGIGDFSKIILNASLSGTFYAKVTESGMNSEISSYSIRFGLAAVAASWTFMVYLDGDNNLEEVGMTDFLEMSSVGSSADVNIVVQMDRSPWYPETYGNWTDTKRFFVTPGMTPDASNALMDLGEMNMGRQETLKDFITWSTTSYPADNYVLVLWDHGGGWDGAVCVDDTDSDILTLDEVEWALSGNMNETGEWIDVLAFDACLMGMAEVSYEFREWTSLMVASEESIPWDGWPYNTIMADLVSDPYMSLNDFGSVVVQRYMQSYGYYDLETMSAIDIAAADELYAAVNVLSYHLMDMLGLNDSPINSAHSATEWYSYPDYLDLGDFATTLISMLPDGPAKSAAMNVTSALGMAVVAEGHGNGHEDASGVSIYFPAWGYLDSYGLLDFALDTVWDDFVREYAAGGSSEDLYEPDDDFTDASLILFGEMQTHSIHAPSDVDWATFSVYNTTDVTIRTSGPQGGYGDTELYLFDAYGVPNDPIAYSDDYNGWWSQISYTVGNGTYYIAVTSYAMSSLIPEYYLSLEVGGGSNQVPVPVIYIYPDPVSVGQMATFDGGFSYDHDGYIIDWYWWFDDGTPVWGPVVNYSYSSAGTHWVQLTVVDDDGAAGSMTMYFEVVGEVTPDEYEPDDDYLNATLLTTFMVQTHSLHDGGADVDWMTFTLDQTYDVKLDVTMHYSSYGFVNMTLFSSAGVPDQAIAHNDWTNESRYLVIECVIDPGTYYIRITNSWGMSEVPRYDITMGLRSPPAGDAYEPDDIYLDATEMGMMTSQTHSILKEGRDVDWVKFTLTEPTDVGIMTSGPLDQWTDTVLTLFDSSDVPVDFITWNDDYSGDLWSMIKASLLPGTYYVMVNAYDFSQEIPVYWLELNYSENINMPPWAYFYIDPWTPSVGDDIVFDGSPSYDEDGSIVSWSWDFGDGTNGSGALVNHTYYAEAFYVVSLTVTDDDGAMGSYNVGISVVENDPPVVYLSAYPMSPVLYESVYLDGYGSYDPDGYIVQYMWTIDNASWFSSYPYTVTYFTTPGNHQATLTAFDNLGASASMTVVISINQPPVAVFDVSPDVGKVGGVCTFDASASYDPDGDQLSIEWYFGDGVMLTGAIVDYVFNEPGVHDITLYVSDEHGSWTHANISYQVVVAVPPVAIISYSPARPVVGELATFDAYASLDPDGAIVTYIWQFGDGAVSTGQVVTHAYAHPGIYTVKLTVIDEDNLVDEDAGTITVASTPVAQFEHMPITPSAGKAVNFFAVGSSDESGIVEYVWDFGDGYYGNGWQAVHTYDVAGTYTVTLTVKNAYGITATVSDLLTVTAASSLPPTPPDLTGGGHDDTADWSARATSVASANSVVGGLMNGGTLLIIGLAALACGAVRARARR